MGASKTNNRRMYSLFWLVPAMLGLALAGCAKPHYQAAPLESIRAELGAVGVVTASLEPATSFEGYARGRLSGAGRGAALGALSMMAAGPHDSLLLLLTMPPAAAIGAVGGVIVSDPKKVIEASEAEAREALADLRIQDSLQEKVVEHARKEAPYRILLMTEIAEERRIYTDTAAEQGVDTVLELAVLRIGSRGPGINAPVALFLTSRARLLRARDGLLLFEGSYEFISENRKFTDWCADNAVLLRQAYRQGLGDLAGQIVDDLFLSLSPDEVAQLQVIEPAGRIGRRGIASLQPTFAWEAFPRPEDQAWLGGREIDNVTYELQVIRIDEPRFPERVFVLRGLSSPVHTLEAPLVPKKKYRWMVRSRFELQGEVRVIEWSSPAEFKTPKR